MTLHERINHASPKIKNFFTKIWYQYLAGLPHARDLLFMNFGYAAVKEGDSHPELSAEDEDCRLNIQLYHHTTHTTPLAGKRMLEVGCGRGGGSAYIARYLEPAHITGLDYVGKVVQFCKRHHKVPNLEFVRGDAMNLPFADNVMDVVLNVESAHTYVSFPTFCSEVYRVLKPGACFLITDVRDVDKIPVVKQAIMDTGFRMEEEEDISRNALRSLELDNERRSQAIKAKAPAFLHQSLLQFAATKESWLYKWLLEGNFQYFRFKLRKPALT